VIATCWATYPPLEDPTSTAEEIKHLAELRAAGTLTEEEFQQAKARALA